MSDFDKKLKATVEEARPKNERQSHQDYVRSLREYGRPSSTGVEKPPTWKRTDPEVACPNCGGVLAEITARVKVAQLKGGVGTAFYLGCPACPFASPAMTVSDQAGK